MAHKRGYGKKIHKFPNKHKSPSIQKGGEGENGRKEARNKRPESLSKGTKVPRIVAGERVAGGGDWGSAAAREPAPVLFRIRGFPVRSEDRVQSFSVAGSVGPTETKNYRTGWQVDRE